MTNESEAAFLSGQIDTYHDNGMWKNRAEGEPLTISEHATREGAVLAGRALAEARGVTHIVLNEDGTVAERHSYGPPLPPGRPGGLETG